MLLLLGSLTFTAFSLEVSDTSGRLGILVTLVLALIAFKLVLSQSLPAISYLTILDWFTLGSVITIFSVSFGISILNAVVHTDSGALFADKILFYCTGAIWIAENVVFVSYIFVVYNRRSATMKRCSESYERHIDTYGLRAHFHEGYAESRSTTTEIKTKVAKLRTE